MKKYNRNLTNVLNISDLLVLGMHGEEDSIIISTKHQYKKAKCPTCGTLSSKLHQNHPGVVRDLPIGGRDVYLRINRRQFKCVVCRKLFSEVLSFVPKRKSYTQRLANTVVNEVASSNVHTVAKKYHLTDDEVWSMVKEIGDKVIPKKQNKLKRIGIDEISLVKGQGKFIVVIVDLERHKLIELVARRKQKYIKAAMMAWGEEVLSEIEEVSIDMTGNYKYLVNQICPNALVTVDRFHVMKVVNSELNRGRISQLEVAKSLGVKEKEQLMSNLKGRKYTLLKNQEDLTELELERLNKLKEASPQLEIMHILKEEFRQIFETAKGFGDGFLKIVDWLIKAEKYYTKSVPTIKRWLGEIVGYFDYKTTSGIVEGINNKLKLIKRSGFGFRNFDNFRIISLISWNLHNEFT
jgi:transposase